MPSDEQHVASVRALANQICIHTWNESVKDYNLRIALDLLTRVVGLLANQQPVLEHIAWEDIERKLDLAHRAVVSVIPKN